jgi:hypothetical protein
MSLESAVSMGTLPEARRRRCSGEHEKLAAPTTCKESKSRFGRTSTTKHFDPLVASTSTFCTNRTRTLWSANGQKDATTQRTWKQTRHAHTHTTATTRPRLASLALNCVDRRLLGSFWRALTMAGGWFWRLDRAKARPPRRAFRNRVPVTGDMKEKKVYFLKRVSEEIRR